MSPDDGGSTVASMRSSEVLPAPLGPSRPSTPEPADRLRPSTALFAPNDRVTLVSSMFTVPFLGRSRSRRRPGCVSHGAVADGGSRRALGLDFAALAGPRYHGPGQ